MSYLKRYREGNRGNQTPVDLPAKGDTDDSEERDFDFASLELVGLAQRYFPSSSSSLSSVDGIDFFEYKSLPKSSFPLENFFTASSSSSDSDDYGDMDLDGLKSFEIFRNVNILDDDDDATMINENSSINSSSSADSESSEEKEVVGKVDNDLFIEYIKRGDFDKVTEMIEENPDFDPSFDDNSAIFTALQTNYYEIIELLMSHPQVIETVSLRRLAQDCGRHGSRYNHIIKRYLESGDVHDNFFEICFASTLFFNREILEILVADTRVDVREGIDYGLNAMIKNSNTYSPENAEGIIRFLMENNHENHFQYFKTPVTQLAIEHDNLRLLLELISPDCYGPVTLNPAYMDRLLKQGRNELPILALALAPALTTYKAFIGEDVQWLTEPIKWFANSSVEEIKASKETIEAHEPEVQTAFLAHVALYSEMEIVQFLFSLDLQLDYNIVTMMMVALITCEDLTMFSYCCKQDAIKQWLTLERLNTITEWYIQHNKAKGKMQMFKIFFLESHLFGSLHEHLAKLDGTIGDLEENFEKFRVIVEVLDEQKLHGLAVLGRLVFSHHTAMITLHTRGIYIPLEIRNTILKKLIKQNE